MSAAVIEARNTLLDRQQKLGKRNRWRFLCAVLPHRWRFTHLFDDAPGFQFVRDRGGSNYAGVCPRCGARDLFRGPLREQGWKDFREGKLT